jgi:hypothetical protein
MTAAWLCATVIVATMAFAGCAQETRSTAQQRTGMDAITWGTPSNHLRLGLSVPGDGGVVELHLENVGTQPLKVLSHVDAGELHFDWYRLRLEDAQGRSTTVRLLDARERSAEISATLDPGGSLTHRVNAADWARRDGQPVSPGTYKVWATYDVTIGDGHWQGHLETGPVSLRVGAKESPGP